MCRAGLPDRLVQLSLTLYFMNVSPYELHEYVNKDHTQLCEYKIKNYDEESELQKMPTPICPILTLNYVEDPDEFYFGPYVKETITKLAKEQVYFTNLPQDVLKTYAETVEASGGSGRSTGSHWSPGKPLEELVPLSMPVIPMYEQNKSNKFAFYFGKRRNLSTTALLWHDVHEVRNVADRDVQVQEVRDFDDTLRSEPMFEVFKPFFGECRKIDLEEFSVSLMHEFWALRETKERVRGKYVTAYLTAY